MTNKFSTIILRLYKNGSIDYYFFFIKLVIFNSSYNCLMINRLRICQNDKK
jgi:hypothetical protein